MAPPADMQKTKKRHPIAAGLLNLISPGLGFLYVGKVSLAIAYPLGMILLIALLFGTRVVFVPLGFLINLSAFLVWFVSSIVLAVLIARRQGLVTLSKWQRWYVYLGFYVICSADFGVLAENRNKLFGYDSFHFKSDAMADTLMKGDYVVSDTWTYHVRTPQRGEVIVFRFPDPPVKVIRRVIGLPGDTVVMKDGAIYVNGKHLDEPYVRPEDNQRTSQVNTEYQVPLGEYFVLGDNRDHASDGRLWGAIPKENVYGGIGFIWFSYNQASGLRTDRIGKVVE